MSVMERLRQAWQGLVGKKFSDKALQKEMDLLENLIYLTHRKMPVGSPPDDAIAHAEQISPEERQLKVTELVHEQVKSIMIALHMENDPQYVGSASRVDHSFDVRESSMAGAGMGVFLRGNVRAGSRNESLSMKLNDPEFRLAITGDSLIDPYNIVHDQELQQVDAALIVKNRLALGHMVLISKSDIPDGSEILLDYRLNPKKKKYWPSWYTPVDVDAAKRRWAYF
ncbi:hypothetical protein GUITHDRAFT_105460 [Guillardia theta CCMP2712]|uniref:SET domain-containing protein n=1 Tax=Guillardia theta (strain CCMP2712) TaxID=905079 RepID=L1JK35_GUITC|nr:hypothetical protein GUITHDRAFT_105460 [Guillardia theta CCMP2712]EKX48836.1 hypothetical protein GUITHDRAFT_105460 [Guillardia theta CCMP2712]|eukprot:XP_005835816.1 hypothetical protein GUITHDRAFT_105460 [Guillardia theta CCMP2712]